MTNVILLAHTQDTIINQNIFCLLSLLHQLERCAGTPTYTNVRIVVYTDQPERFRRFYGADRRIHYEILTTERLREWRGDIDFVHRVKIQMLRDATAKISAGNLADSSIFYVDGDTVFIKDPSPLFAKIDKNNSFMHECENYLDEGRDPLSKKMARFLSKEWPAHFNDQVESGHGNDRVRKLGSHVAMWNSGVLGFAPAFYPLLSDVLQLTDELYSLYPKHVMEQLALSFYLQEYTKVHDTREYILHYWRDKVAYDIWIGQFLAQNTNFEAALSHFELPKIPTAQPQPRRSIFSSMFKSFQR